MRGCVSRRGSALLIVLGMMSFIVVSAVAFSAYMRYARLPSSYLRRTSSARLLVKAALAEAVDTIDRAIGNNPYPGVGLSGSSAQGRRNIWRDRVFIGSDTLTEPDQTVSTLSLEGLAYIPPAFINDVRYYSRRSPAAEWHTMSFDAGRYAFCAINVSDCFDVNRILADAARDSSDEGRISLAHCFENASHTGYTLKPEKWDTFMENYTDASGSKVPLVSVADLNLAINKDLSGEREYMSPFCDYLQQGTDAKFVVSDSQTDPTVLLQQNLAFVTDSLFPVTNRVNGVDLSRAQEQPFAGHRLAKEDNPKANDDTADDVMDQGSGKFVDNYSRWMGDAELMQLYDYIDRDSVPLSLAFPTVERTPMITGVGIDDDSIKVVMRKKQAVEFADPTSPMIPGTTNPRYAYRVTTADLSLSGNFSVTASFVYPFKYGRGNSVPSFKAQAAATITFVRAGAENSLRERSAKAPAVIAKDDWSSSSKPVSLAKYGNEEAPIVLTMISAPKTLSVPKKIDQEEDAVMDDALFDFSLPGSQAFVGKFQASALLAGVAVPGDMESGSFRLVERIDKQTNQTAAGTTPEFVTTIQPSAPDLSGTVAMAAGEKYVPVIQVWVRIVNADNKTVDLVPACAADDETKSDFVSACRGSNYRPFLRFSHEGNVDDVAITLDPSVMDLGGKDLTPAPKTYLADDPRWNYAPENLMALNDKLTGNLWFEKQRSQSRDGDIFMMTSDAGYLQSIYELTALSRVSDFKVGSPAALGTPAYNGERRGNFGSTPADDAMWRTYTGFGNNSDIARKFDAINGSRGFRINPYTRDLNIMMAALANTPLDWWAASTNNVDDAEKKQMCDTVDKRVVLNLQQAGKYTFSEKSQYAKMKHGDRSNPQNSLTELAQKIMDRMGNAGDNWENAFDRMNWTEEDKIEGVDLGVSLHSVDKKFLHGYWRECFANRQQLFLIFVRAEPMMMGGGGLGQTPPQLGARAVALVWRDPTRVQEDASASGESGNTRPHRTRLLFYRQLD